MMYTCYIIIIDPSFYERVDTMANIAIYARKSVFKEDSISVESQIEFCQYETRGEDYRVYKDNGYSGKNTDRPDFQRMMEDIKAGRINKVIVYKLDRISRSVLDFSEMMEKFQKYNVDFVSATEHFDTSSPMGRAMLNICIVFAQLERETIQQRVIDAYASRSKKGFYMGGKIPYGYKKIPVTIDGVSTSMYEQIPEEASDIRLIYELYSKPSATLGDVLRELRALNKGKNKRDKWWSTARLSELMRNPAYAIADLDMYNFFKEQKSNVINAPDEYNGVTSLYLFSGTNTNRKTWDLTGQNIVIAPHIGIVPSELWIACRRKLLNNHQVKTCKAKNSILSGKIKCGYCGYVMHIIQSNKHVDGTRTKYFRCNGYFQNRCCTAKFPTLYATEIERLFVEELRKKINSMNIESHNRNNEIQTLEEIQLSERMSDIDKQIDQLLNNITDADTTVMKYINRKITELDKERTIISERINTLKKNKESNNKKSEKITSAMDKWDSLNFDEKRCVIELMVSKVNMYVDTMEIIWNC